MRNSFFSRAFCSGNKRTTEWTEENIVYLDETGDVIFSGKGGVRSKPFSKDSAITKIVEIVRRWKWGPEMETQLDKLYFVPNMSHINQAVKEIGETDASLSLFRWAKRQSWYSPMDEMYSLFDRLNQSRDYEGLQSLFDEMVCDKKDGDHNNEISSFTAYNRVIQHLAKAEKLEVSFCCFKKIQDSGCKIDTQTYNSLITLFLTKVLPYKDNHDLLIPSLAKSGRLDAAFKLFQVMKEKGFRPNCSIFSSLIDSMGKAGRLDTSMKVYMEMQGFGLRPASATYVSLIESFVKAGKLETALKLWDEMKKSGFRPNYGLYTMIVESHAKSGKLETAMSVFSYMEKAGFLPTPSTYSCQLEMHASSGQVDSAMKLYNSMTNAGLRPGLSTYTSLLTVLANKKLVDVAAKILLEMKAVGFTVDISASDVLMIYIKDGAVDLALRWLRFMGSSGIRTNNFIIRQLFESCMKNEMYESAKPLLDTYDEQNERHLMSILSATKHKAHSFMCGLFTGPEQRKKPEIDFKLEEGAARYSVNVLLNYLVFMGQINRARCVWKVSYENKLFPKAIVFNQHIAWSLDVRSLSVGAALIAVVHTLHRFRKRMLYYGVVPRRIKLVTGPTLKIVISQVRSAVESPFEVSKVVLRACRFSLGMVQEANYILLLKLNMLFPNSAPGIRSFSPPKPLVMVKDM
ncbi:hypothetical protein MKX01_017168 [Papaver californicum]|nr:hypothetical protein MKX01_017168 [Papaver californicum]